MLVPCLEVPSCRQGALRARLARSTQGGERVPAQRHVGNPWQGPAATRSIPVSSFDRATCERRMDQCTATQRVARSWDNPLGPEVGVATRSWCRLRVRDAHSAARSSSECARCDIQQSGCEGPELTWAGPLNKRVRPRLAQRCSPQWCLKVSSASAAVFACDCHLTAPARATERACSC